MKTISAITRPHLLSRTVPAALLLLTLLLALTSVSAAQGGKAEPSRVLFKRDATSATLTGTVRRDEQFEYVVAAKAGQWMFVEVTANPSDSAIFTTKDPAGEEGAFHYSWSDTLAQSGDYLISISKTEGFAVSRFTLTITIASQPPKTKNEANDPESVALFRAMRKFIDALRNKNSAAFLSLFSRTSPWFHLNPMNVGSREHFRARYTYAELARDVSKKRELYYLLLERGENGDYDAFVDNVPDSTMWTRVKGNKFIPPGNSLSSHTYVRWRKEGGRWVVDEISYATA